MWPLDLKKIFMRAHRSRKTFHPFSRNVDSQLDALWTQSTGLYSNWHIIRPICSKWFVWLSSRRWIGINMDVSHLKSVGVSVSCQFSTLVFHPGDWLTQGRVAAKFNVTVTAPQLVMQENNRPSIARRAGEDLSWAEQSILFLCTSCINTGRERIACGTAAESEFKTKSSGNSWNCHHQCYRSYRWAKPIWPRGNRRAKDFKVYQKETWCYTTEGKRHYWWFWNFCQCLLWQYNFRFRFRIPAVWRWGASWFKFEYFARLPWTKSTKTSIAFSFHCIGKRIVGSSGYCVTGKQGQRYCSQDGQGKWGKKTTWSCKKTKKHAHTSSAGWQKCHRFHWAKGWTRSSPWISQCCSTCLYVPMVVLSDSDDEAKVGVQGSAAESAPSAPMGSRPSSASAEAAKPSSANIQYEESSVLMTTEGVPATKPAADDSQKSNAEASSGARAKPAPKPIFNASMVWLDNIPVVERTDKKGFVSWPDSDLLVCTDIMQWTNKQKTISENCLHMCQCQSLYRCIRPGCFLCDLPLSQVGEGGPHGAQMQKGDFRHCDCVPLGRGSCWNDCLVFSAMFLVALMSRHTHTYTRTSVYIQK